MRSRASSLFAVLAAALLLPAPSIALETPLSDEAVRDAYFLGQRHEQDFVDLMGKYTTALPTPETGPDISSITFLTPFALVAQLSSQRTMNYSAQQAEQDHRNQEEIVRVIVQIELTETYGPLIPTPTGSSSSSPIGFVQRPSDFWKDFQVAVLVEDKSIPPLNASGEPLFNCGTDGGCMLAGATLQFDYPAQAFTADSTTIQITPPEGDPVSVDFDLSRLR
jgi:hypothetical protein